MELFPTRFVKRRFGLSGLIPLWRGLWGSIRRGCGSGCRWLGRCCTIRRCCCWTSHFRMWTSTRRARWRACSRACAIGARRFFWLRIRRRCWKALPMNSSGCRRGKSWSVGAICHERGRNSDDLVLGGDVRDLGEGYPAGVALERCAELDAFFFSAGGGDLQFFFRSVGGGVAAHCRRVDLGGVPVRGGGGAESDVGA